VESVVIVDQAHAFAEFQRLMADDVQALAGTTQADVPPRVEIAASDASSAAAVTPVGASPPPDV
jgi:hypothetical protein